MTYSVRTMENLRGCSAWLNVDGRVCHVEIVTHIRNDCWLVEGRRLPKWCERGYPPVRRLVVPRCYLSLIER